MNPFASLEISILKMEIYYYRDFYLETSRPVNPLGSGFNSGP